MRNWELASVQRRKVSPSESSEAGDFITISRQVGIPAEEIGNRIGEKLKWPVFGRNLLDAMSGDDIVRRRIYSSMDQRDLTWYEETLRAIFEEGFVRNDYFNRLCETVLSLAKQSAGVFVGRGCDLLLPADAGFRFRLVAPFEERLAHYSQANGLPTAVARGELERVQRERDEFIQHHFRIDATDPLRHDLTLNLGRVSAEAVVSTILAACEIRRAAPLPVGVCAGAE